MKHPLHTPVLLRTAGAIAIALALTACAEMGGTKPASASLYDRLGG